MQLVAVLGYGDAAFFDIRLLKEPAEDQSNGKKDTDLFTTEHWTTVSLKGTLCEVFQNSSICLTRFYIQYATS